MVRGRGVTTPMMGTEYCSVRDFPSARARSADPGPRPLDPPTPLARRAGVALDRFAGRSPRRHRTPWRRIAATSATSSSGPRGVASIEPAGVDRLVLRRYVAFLTTRRYAKRTIARKVAALRRYFALAAPRRRHRRRSQRVAAGAIRRGSAASGAVGHRDRPLARRARRPTTSRCGGGIATMPCSSCSTAVVCVSASCAGLDVDHVDLAAAHGDRVGQGRQATAGAAQRPCVRRAARVAAVCATT